MRSESGAGGRLPVAGGRKMHVTLWPLATGHWQPATGCYRPRATGHWPLATGNRPPATGNRQLIDTRSMLSDLDSLMAARGIGAVVVPMHEAMHASFRWLTRGA